MNERLIDELGAMRRSVTEWRGNLRERRGARDQLNRTRRAEAEAAERCRTMQRQHEQAHLFLMSEVVEMRSKALDYISMMASASLRLVYGPGYQLKFETFDEKRKDEGAANFKMELRLVSPYNDDASGEISTALTDEERGGGVLETAAVSLRNGALEWMGYDGPMLLDEAYKSLSDDEKIMAIARFLRQITDVTGRQMIFVTHKAGVFSEVADRIIKVYTNSEGEPASVEVLESERFDPEDIED